MSTQAGFALRGRNPDVLSCIANLSNDEVFTPPDFAGQMLDSLAKAWSDDHNGADIWSDPNVRFLDPCTKSGVFLREITSRLTRGLESQIPDLQDRVDHILSNQVFGIGISHLTSLLARRSLYCSKRALGEHSISKKLESDAGNIWFQRTDHTWASGRCTVCGAGRDTVDRGEGLETHAYAFIHAADSRELVAKLFGGDMQFDVIIGNPPYQLNDGGGEGASATPLYHRFVEQAKTLDPRQLVMVIPARWYSGGKGLDEFREAMLGDGHLAEIHDFPETDLVFPGLNIRGGVCFFRWSPAHTGPAKITNYRKGAEPSSAIRPVLESGLTTFVRHNAAISILTKVRSAQEPTLDLRVQSRNPYGIPSNFTDFSTKKTAKSSVLLYRSRRGSSADRQVFISADQIASNADFKDKIKVLVSKASPGGDELPHAVLGAPIIAPPGSVSTETYLIIDFPGDQDEARNLVGYMRTRFFRFLVSLIKTTQNISKGSFAFVPVQDLSRAWTDADLYAKYKLNDEEIAFIESMVRARPDTDE